MLMTVPFVYVICLSSLLIEAKVVEWVQRRQISDIYSFVNSSHITCERNTYLVDENQCVSDQELIRGR